MWFNNHFVFVCLTFLLLNNIGFEFLLTKLYSFTILQRGIKIAKTETLHTILTDLKIGETSGADLIEKIQEEVTEIVDTL